MRRLTPALLALLLIACADARREASDAAPSATDSPSADPQAVTDPQQEFWSNLLTLCDGAYSGRVVEAPAGDTTLTGKPLVMHVRLCSDEEIRMPFHVGENRSRTWVLTRSELGLRLTHDHRHEDGNSDKVTGYGGEATDAGSGTVQEFGADEHTAMLIPDAETNIWTIEVVPGRMFVYALRREGTDRRYRIEFDLTRRVETPPAPWGQS
jgi:hypothetical protein